MSPAMEGVLMRKEDAIVVTLFARKLCPVITSRESFSASSLLLDRREKVLRAGWKAVTACSSSGREIVKDLMIVLNDSAVCMPPVN